LAFCLFTEKGSVLQTKIQHLFVCILSIGLIGSSVITGCQPAPKENINLGIITLIPAMEPIVTGFKQEMTDRGYVEGENINYQYTGPANDVDKLDTEAKKLVDAGVDIIVSVTTPGSQAAYKAVQNTPIPIVFIAVTDPIIAGLVTDLNNHEENITGILAGAKDSQSEGRRLEIFMQVVPGVQSLYLPFNPDDPAAMESVKAVHDAARVLNISLVEAPVRNEEEALKAITPPEGVDGVFLPNDRLIGSVIEQFVRTANENKLPTTLNNPVGLESAGALMAYGPDFETMGKQAARLVVQILKGVPATDLPIEVPELLIGLNLNTAELIGLKVPDEILRLATIVIR